MREFVLISSQPYVYIDHEWETVGLYPGIDISLHASLVTTCVFVFFLIHLCMIVMVRFISNLKMVYIQQPVTV